MTEIRNDYGYDDRTAIPTDTLVHLLSEEAEYKEIIRIINKHKTYETEELGKLLMKLYKIEED